MLLGFNGSPKPDSNTRRMIETILKKSGKEYRIYDLAKMNIRPCVGCVKCAKDNRCVVKDDMHPLYDEIIKSEGIVVGAVVYFGKANGFTHNFLERLFPLRHLKPQTIGKPAVALAIGGNEAEGGSAGKRPCPADPTSTRAMDGVESKVSRYLTPPTPGKFGVNVRRAGGVFK